MEGKGEGAKDPTLLKICYTYPTIMKLGRVIPLPKGDVESI